MSDIKRYGLEGEHGFIEIGECATGPYVTYEDYKERSDKFDKAWAKLKKSRKEQGKLIVEKEKFSAALDKLAEQMDPGNGDYWRKWAMEEPDE